MKLRVKSDEIINALETNVWIIDLDGGYSLIFGRLNHEYISLAYGKKSEDNQFLPCFDLNLNTYIEPFRLEGEFNEDLKTSIVYQLIDCMMNYLIGYLHQQQNAASDKIKVIYIKDLIENMHKNSTIMTVFAETMVTHFDELIEVYDIRPTKTKLSLVFDNTPKILH